jgi:hypothetical protein
MKLLCSLLILICANSALAGVQIPNGLDRTDRQEAIRILGFGTSSKILTDPYPLGGYAGFEVGIQIENLPAEDLGRLGNTITTPQQDITYPKLTFGKGLFNNIDAFIHFVPYTQKLDQSQFGGTVRWGFFQAKYLPITLSTLVHFNNANINNQVTTRTFGLDLVGGINADNVALYVGAGPIQSRGRFVGGANGVTDTGNVEVENVNGVHSVIGANVHVASLFVALQIDRYENTTYSGKVGIRF